MSVWYFTFAISGEVLINEWIQFHPVVQTSKHNCVLEFRIILSTAVTRTCVLKSWNNMNSLLERVHNMHCYKHTDCVVEPPAASTCHCGPLWREKLTPSLHVYYPTWWTVVTLHNPPTIPLSHLSAHVLILLPTSSLSGYTLSKLPTHPHLTYITHIYYINILIKNL